MKPWVLTCCLFWWLVAVTGDALWLFCAVHFTVLVVCLACRTLDRHRRPRVAAPSAAADRPAEDPA